MSTTQEIATKTPRSARKQAQKEKQELFMAHVDSLLRQYLGVFEEYIRYDERKKTNRNEPRIMNINNEEPLNAKGIRTMTKRVFKVIESIPDEIADIEKSCKPPAKRSIRLVCVNDELYSFFKTWYKRSFNRDLAQDMGKLVKGAEKTNFVETSKIVGLIVNHFAASEGNTETIQDGDKKLKCNVVSDEFRDFFGGENSAKLVVDRKEVTNTRGAKNHSQEDVDALSHIPVGKKPNMRFVERSSILDALREKRSLVEKGDFETYRSTTLSHTLCSICTVPKSFWTKEEHAVYQNAVDDFDGYNERLDVLYTSLREN